MSNRPRPQRRPWYDDPGARAWLADAQRNLLPKMEDSAVIMSIYSGEPDAKLAVETGFAVLLDKPMIGLVVPGAKAPAKLIAVCDELLEVDLGTPEGNASAQRRMVEAMKRLGLDS
jgi:hypothetical protein